MGQIIGGSAKPKRCNLNQLSQVPTPAAGEHILVSSDNSMNAAGQGYFDSYIVGVGNVAATALPLHKFKAEELDEQLNGIDDVLLEYQVPLVTSTKLDVTYPCQLDANKTYHFVIENASTLLANHSIFYVYLRNLSDSDKTNFYIGSSTTPVGSMEVRYNNHTDVYITTTDAVGYIRFYAPAKMMLDTVELPVSLSWLSNNKGLLPTLATIDYVDENVDALESEIEQHSYIQDTQTDFGDSSNYYLDPVDGGDQTQFYPSCQRVTIINDNYKKVVATIGSNSTSSAAIVFSSSDSPSGGFISAVRFIEETHTYEVEVPNGTNYIFVSNRQASCQSPSVTTYQNIEKVVEALMSEESSGASSMASSFNLSPDITYISHRGAHVNGIAPDNSVDAVYLAARAGFKYTEMDLRKTRDGEFICMHGSMHGNVYDSNYNPSSVTTGMYPEFYTLNELRSGYVLVSQNEEMRKPIPTFEEMLWACKKAGIKPYIHCIIVSAGTYQGDPDTSTSLAYRDASRDVPLIWNLIKTIFGSDDICWGGTYSINIRPLSENVNVCCYLNGTFGEMTSEAASSMYSIYGEKTHTNANAYGSGSYYSFGNSAPLKVAGIQVGVYETGVNPNFEWLMEGGLDLIVTDYVAPHPNGKPSVFAADGKNGNYSDFITTGVVGEDGITLVSGQNVMLAKSPHNLYFGGFYVAFELVGAGTIEMNGYSAGYSSANPLSVSETDENHIFVYQYMTHNVVPSFKFTATSNCVIKNIKVHQVEF